MIFAHLSNQLIRSPKNGKTGVKTEKTGVRKTGVKKPGSQKTGVKNRGQNTVISNIRDKNRGQNTVISNMNGTKLSPSDTSAMRQYIESEEEGWLGIG